MRKPRGGARELGGAGGDQCEQAETKIRIVEVRGSEATAEATVGALARQYKLRLRLCERGAEAPEAGA